MPSPSVTYSFSNSTTADATQVNQNFTDLINGMTDGTKDLSISAFTAAGNVTFNGNTTVGNSSSDDLTVTASLASTLSIKTTNTYDIGSSSIGLRALYFGANSQTVNIKGSASMSATWTLTLPVSAGSNSGDVLSTNAAGVTSWITITTPWVAYTPTFTGFGTASAITFYSRRVGDTLEVRGKFTSGTSTATEARVTLGFNGTNSNVTSSAAIATLEHAGIGAASVVAAATWNVLCEPSVGYFTFGTGQAASAALVKKNASSFLASGDTLSFRAAVPITGW